MNKIVCLCLLVAAVKAAPKSEKITNGALNYMANLGYYKFPKANAALLDTEKAIKNAITDMQRFAGIPVSGILDEATRKLMETPRCGMKDVSRNHIGVKRKRRYTLQGSKWFKEDLTWKLVNDNNDGLTREQVEDAMTQAFEKWHKITNLNFRKLDYKNPATADIVVSFGTRNHGDHFPFDGPGGTLAHAFYPHNNQGLSGDVHFDDDEVYTIGSSTGKSLLWVAVHEIGHSIGLEHSNIKEAVMYPWYRGNGGKDFDLNEDDIVGAQHIYGSRATDPDERVTQPTQTTTSIAPGKTLPPAPACIDEFKAALLHRSTGKTYIINDRFVYILARNLGMESGPIPVNKIFPGMDTVDSLYYNKDGNIVVFSGKDYFVYNDVKSRRIESGTIQGKYGVGDEINKIDAAFIWSGNGRTYLFANKIYYRFDEARGSIDRGYPKVIKGNWKGLPDSIDGVSIWRNKVTYFFKDKMYYRFNDKKINVDKGYPKPINPIWTKCTVAQVKDGSGSGSVTAHASVITTVLMTLIVKLFL